MPTITPRPRLRPAARWKLTRIVRRRIELAAGLVLAMGACSLLAISGAPASADPQKLEGKQVPSALVPAITSAALSCPSLSPPRLAAQIMAASGFAPGAKGIAGLDDQEWKQWRPGPAAQRTDNDANVVALAHHTCELVGRLRAAKLEGDMWPLALAADEVGLAAVTKAKGVPSSAKNTVDRIQAYAYWYADQAAFRTGDPKSPAPTPSVTATAVPAAYVKAVREAGSVCSTITPARVAAQLMAVSTFDPNLRSSSGAQGIAQFTPALWTQYRLSGTSSVWDPSDAIPALGHAMCDYAAQLHALTGADPYVLALAAWQWGDAAVREANGIPRANVSQLATIAVQYVAYYEKDTALGGSTATASASPSVSGSAGASASASARPGASASGTGPASGQTTEPAPEATTATTSASGGLYTIGKTYQLLNDWTNAVAELPGTDTDTTAGDHVQLWKNGSQKDQYWKVVAGSDAGCVVFVNAYSGKAMSVEPGGTWNGAKILQEDVDKSDGYQEWTIRDAGNGKVHIFNHATGKALDVLGTDVAPTADDGTWNGHWVEQWDLASSERDQLWSLM